MAIAFSGTAQFLSISSALVSAAPVTFACWFNTSVPLTVSVLMSVEDATIANGFSMFLNGASGVNAFTAAASTSASATTSTTFSANTWNHACAVFASSTSRTAYLNGGGAVTNATALTPGALTSSGIGVNSGTSANPMTGSIAVPAMWNIALSANDVANLALGASPATIHPEALIQYTRLDGVPVFDPVLQKAWTVTGAPVYAADPTIFGKPVLTGTGFGRIII